MLMFIIYADMFYDYVILCHDFVKKYSYFIDGSLFQEFPKFPD